MQVPLQIVARDFPLSEAAEAEVREKVGKLERFCHQILHCRVALEGAVQHHRRGGPYKVRIDLTVPGAEPVASHEDYVRRRRGEVKGHATPPHAWASRLFPEEGYGFLETPNGREIYFYQNSVLESGFDHLKFGMEDRGAGCQRPPGKHYSPREPQVSGFSCENIISKGRGSMSGAELEQSALQGTP